MIPQKYVLCAEILRKGCGNDKNWEQQGMDYFSFKKGKTKIILRLDK